MVGTIWQWSDEFCDEHTCRAIVRGGSWYVATLSLSNCTILYDVITPHSELQRLARGHHLTFSESTMG